jgi:invasion protein IalB
MAYPVKFSHNRSLITAVAACVLTVPATSGVKAEQVATTQSTAKPQPKKPPATPSSQSVGTEQPLTSVPAQPEFNFSAWTKSCFEQAGKKYCGVLSKAQVKTGQVAVAVALVESVDGTQRLLRLTLPLGVRLEPGTRIMVDEDTPTEGYYIVCLASGCVSNYEINSDFIDKLKKGQKLTIQAINPGGYPISISLPLADFAKSYDGRPTDENALADSQKKLQEELERRAEQARKKLGGQQPSSPSQ